MRSFVRHVPSISKGRNSGCMNSTTGNPHARSLVCVDNLDYRNDVKGTFWCGHFCRTRRTSGSKRPQFRQGSRPAEVARSMNQSGVTLVRWALHGEFVQCGVCKLHAVPRGVRRHVATMLHHDRITDVLMQVIRVLCDSIFHRAGNTDVVNDAGVLDVFTESYATCVRTNRDIESRGQQHDGHDFIHAAQTTTIQLTNL